MDREKVYFVLYESKTIIESYPFYSKKAALLFKKEMIKDFGTKVIRFSEAIMPRYVQRFHYNLLKDKYYVKTQK